jgi:hypothetical protein
VVSFRGCHLSLFTGDLVYSLEVPHSAGLQAHLAAGNVQQALQVYDAAGLLPIGIPVQLDIASTRELRVFLLRVNRLPSWV